MYTFINIVKLLLKPTYSVMLIYRGHEQLRPSKKELSQFGHQIYNVFSNIVNCFWKGVIVLSWRHHSLKPIFHKKTRLRWLSNAKEIDTNDMKCTWPTWIPNANTQRKILHWLALGPQRLVLGRQGFALGLPGILATSMLVSPTRNAHVGGLDQHEATTWRGLRCSGI